ncbi:hypothetical protein HU200_062874 [Digitaria exilis]|uniref:Uncharacterized protein n=1 Tax=Digitaria exilis TaxID=1010633 RepID=A0A835A2F7_9POAL|nr:hypothetical protein HU200_062874 [Digitaria exilis]
MGTKLLWTFRGRLRLGFWKTRQVWSSSNHHYIEGDRPASWTSVLEEEAREIALYMHELGLGVTPEIATECCLYLLSLNYRHGDIIDYNWATHACSYWVCDGIVEGGQDNQAWELAHALRHQIRLEDYSSNTVPTFAFKLDVSKKHWISIANSNFDKVPPGTTSLFFATPVQKKAIPVPNDRFHEADQLWVLKLCRCTFSFSLPPFHCCRNLRFLGLDSCMDEDQQGEEEAGARAVETFQRLWVLDVSHTNWELGFPLETEESLATDIREVHINKGRIWRRNLVWRRLPNLRNLRVVEPTSSWETGRQDEFNDMVNLELLDLSGNNSIKVLPSLSGATNLKALVLDGCVGLEHVGPQGLPPSLESFCLSSGLGKGDENKGKISCISLAGCARLADFRLHGSLPNLELDLSHTAVKMLDLKHEAAVQSLQKIFLQGCEQLHSISWPETWLQRYRKVGHRIRLLCIDTRAGREVSKKPSSCDALMVCQGDGEEYCRAFVATADMRFLQSLEFLYETTKLKLNLYFSSTIKEDRTSYYQRR